MPATAAPARMGPPASLSFVLLGAAIAGIGGASPALRSAVRSMALSVAFIALLPLVGFAYGTRELYGVARFTGIAFPTAALLEALALAVLARSADAGDGTIVRRSGGAAALAMRTLVYATAVPLTVGSDAVGSDRHLVATAVLLIGSLLSLIIARQRSQRERDAARLEAQYGVARAIGAAESFEEAAPELLAAIARPLGREVANYWAMGDDGMLRCAG